MDFEELASEFLEDFFRLGRYIAAERSAVR